MFTGHIVNNMYTFNLVCRDCSVGIATR